MEFRLLGDLEVVDGGRRLPLGGRKQRALLALLLLDANRVISSDALIDALWGDGASPKAGANLHTLISRLRRTIGTDRIERHAGGYLLRAVESEIDLCRFERLRNEASTLPPAAASERLGLAIDLWRGPALADFAYERWASIEVERLEELRLGVIEERVEADLARGRHAALVGELQRLVAGHPVREGFRRQLILALYRSGRQAEALDAYQSARRMLDEELGLEPSAALKELEAAVLRQDPSLDAPADGRARVRSGLEERSPPPRRPWVAAVAASTLLAFAVAAGVVWMLNRDDAHRSVAAATPQVARAKPKAKKTTRNVSEPRVRVVTRIVRPRARATVVSRPATRRRPLQQGGAPARQAGDPKAERPTRRPVQPAEPKPAPKPAPRPAPYRVTDDFEDPGTSDFWRRSGAAGVEVTERKGQLQFTFDPAASAEGDGWFGATYESRCRFQGDFDVTIDYELPQWPAANGVSLQATAWFGTHGLTIARQNHAWGEQYNSWTRNGAAVPTADVRGALRLRRKTGTLFSYYRENGAWSVLRTFVFSDPVAILLQAGSTNEFFTDQAVTAAFDNFAVTAPTRPYC